MGSWPTQHGTSGEEAWGGGLPPTLKRKIMSWFFRIPERREKAGKGKDGTGHYGGLGFAKCHARENSCLFILLSAFFFVPLPPET